VEGYICVGPEFNACRRSHPANSSHPKVLSQIVELLAVEKGWWRWRAKKELKQARLFLATFEPEAPTGKPVLPADATPTPVKA